MTRQARPYEPLTSENAALVLIDHQIGLMTGIVGSRARMGAALDCHHRDIGKAFLKRISERKPPVMVNTGPVRDIILTGDDVDLTALPVPLISDLDGGPYITSGIGISRDPEYGRNAGAYRLMIRTRRETSVDLVGASDLKLFYDRAFRQGRGLPFAVAIGTHPSIMMAAAHMAPSGVDEFELAGGLAGAPIELVKCETVDLEVPADAEIVLEGELLPTGWTKDEGRFGDFTGFVGPIKWNPIFRVNAITHRRDPVFYSLHMPDEVDYLVAPPLEGSAWQALATAGIVGKAVYAPAPSGCNFHLYAAIRKRTGEGKNAVLALMSLKRVKHVVVTDDDIDIFDPAQLERALAYRVQPARDIIGPAEQRSVRRVLGQPESRPFKNDDPESEFIREFFATHSHQPRAGIAVKSNNGAATRIAPLGVPDRAPARDEGRPFAPRTNVAIHHA